MTRLAVLVLALMLAVTPFAGSAQTDNAPAVALLPAAETFGDGWVLLATDFPGERHPAIRAVATATYGGPAGARAVLGGLAAYGMQGMQADDDHHDTPMGTAPRG